MKKAVNIFIFIFGMAIMAASLIMGLCLAFSINKTPNYATANERFLDRHTNHNYLTGDDFRLAIILGSITAGLWILLNVIYLVWSRGKDSDYYASVLETIKIPFVRFFGILIFSATVGMALYFFLEYATASEKYPPKYDEWYQFAIVFALFGIILYYLVRLARYLFRKKKTQPAA